jgi:hypothetical protein
MIIINYYLNGEALSQSPFLDCVYSLNLKKTTISSKCIVLNSYSVFKTVHLKQIVFLCYIMLQLLYGWTVQHTRNVVLNDKHCELYISTSRSVSVQCAIWLFPVVL